MPVRCEPRPIALLQVRAKQILWVRKWWGMTAIERTIYSRFTRAPSPKEVHALYTPVPADMAFVERHARGPAQKFSLMIMLKIYQRLHSFPELQTIPGAVISHIRSEMNRVSAILKE